MTRRPVAAFVWLCLSVPFLATPAHALSDPSEMLPNPAQEARAEAVGSQLRCLVCQNESIEDSGADLARDLRHIVRQRVVAGDSDQQIMDWMVARYGDFVRLSPPFNALTALLWASPLVAVLLALGVVVAARRARPTIPKPLDPEEQARLRHLLET
jgi:cytochrome c-type biogenesis protein CcmH